MMTSSMRLIALLAGLFAVALTAEAARAQNDVEVLFATGDEAPGTAPGVVFSSLGVPVINATGQVAFSGTLTGPGIDGSNNVGVWGPDASGALGLLARRGDRAPGTPEEVVFRSFDSLLINAAGQVAFLGTLTGPGIDGSNSVGIWGPDASGALGLLARRGDQAPGTPANVVFSSVGTPVFNAAGQVAFRGFLTGPGIDGSNNFGVWGPDATGALGLLARKGDQAPGTPADVVFFNSDNPVLNAAGQVAFRGVLTGPGIDGSNDAGIWGPDATGALDLLAREGSQAPGTSAGVVFSSIGIPFINAAGQVAFSASLTGPGVDFSNNLGIWGPDASGALGLLVRRGDRAPGTPAGVVFSTLGNPVLNAPGQVAFLGFLTGPGVDSSNQIGIWGPDATGALGLLARKGDQAPGTPENVVFSNFGNPVLNAPGQAAFFGVLTGPGVDFSNNFGVWGPDASGVLGLLAREGDVIETSPGSSASIRFVNLITNTGNGDGRPSGLSDNSQAVLRAGLTSGVAILLSNPNVNAPPVADAGPDQHLECAGPAGTPVGLDGSGSSDPDGDALTYAWSLTQVPPGSAAALDDPTAAKPSFNADRLGDYEAVLVVNDGTLDSGPDMVAVTVEDSLAPGVVAALTPLGEGDEPGDSDEGLFRIEFAAADTCDAAPALAAVLDVGNGVELPAVDGQTIEFEFEDEGVEIEQEDGILEIEAPSLTLRVTATDASGNVATAEVAPSGLTGDNDDDYLASAEDDD